MIPDIHKTVIVTGASQGIGAGKVTDPEVIRCVSLRVTFGSELRAMTKCLRFTLAVNEVLATQTRSFT